VVKGIGFSTSELQNEKTEELDKKSVSSVSVPGAELNSELCLLDLDLIWWFDTDMLHLRSPKL
jgi:hypothetical protein